MNRLNGRSIDPKSTARLASEIHAATQNAMALDGCAGHDCETQSDGWCKCKHCHVVTAAASAYLYKQGVEHGRQEEREA